MGKYDINAHVLGTCIKYCTNDSPLGADETYVWRPNITGNLSQMRCVVSSNPLPFSGALEAITSTSNSRGDSSAPALYEINLNAHNSNAVYTDNGKVYPLSLALNFIIKT